MPLVLTKANLKMTAIMRGSVFRRRKIQQAAVDNNPAGV